MRAAEIIPGRIYRTEGWRAPADFVLVESIEARGEARVRSVLSYRYVETPEGDVERTPLDRPEAEDEVRSMPTRNILVEIARDLDGFAGWKAERDREEAARVRLREAHRAEAADVVARLKAAYPSTYVWSTSDDRRVELSVGVLADLLDKAGR